MFDKVEASVNVMARAAALSSQYLVEAMLSVDTEEMPDLQKDLDRLNGEGVWSARIIEIMRRARLISDADQMLQRMEAA